MDESTKKALEGIRKNGGIEVMKASAGSGKTFSLAREYIRVLLSDNRKYPDERNSHRHILAVTFTNKATEEMKARIVKELNQLADEPRGSAYCSYLIGQCGFSGEEELQKASRVALNELLNDYGSFSVSTIDKFFQRTLRAFSREIGQGAEYRVELDRSSLVDEAADRFWDSLSESGDSRDSNALSSKALLDWVVDCTIDKINNGEGMKIEEAVKEFANGYLSASYEKKMRELGIDESKAFSEENIKRLRDICRQRIKEYWTGLNKAANKLDEVLKALPGGCTLSNNLSKAVEDLLAFGQRDAAVPKCLDAATLSNLVEKPEGAVTGKAKNLLSEADRERISNAASAVLFYGGEQAVVRKTCQQLLRQIVVFRVASNLRKDFNALLKEKNVFGLEDTNTILKDIIDGSDAPFIYEKTGTWFRHFLLDEFQDTSDVQWECFRPLLCNSIADGMYNLIVGDVKQSIYRWREAEWNILGEKVQSELDRVVENPLDTNWRSADKIITFNNSFYEYMAGQLEAKAVEKDIHGCRTGELYCDVKQKSGGKYQSPGHVKALFCESDDLCRFIVEEVRDARRRNYAYKDIAVLVRKNSQGAEVAQALAQADIPIITNDSLTIGSSKAVGKVVSAMFLIENPEDKVHTFGLDGQYDLEAVKDARSLAEMADVLFRQIPAAEVNRESLYVLAFMDLVRDYEANNGYSLHGFLNYWQESGMGKAIASPKDADAVTIITIHKSKGLDYQYVILPFPRKEMILDTIHKNWYTHSDHEAFEGCERALYNVSLSEDSLFKESYDREYLLSEIDFINTWYVAMTRAANEMTIIAPKGKVTVEQRTLLHDFCESRLENGDVHGVRFVKGTASLNDPEDEENVCEAERYDFGEPEDFAHTKALEASRKKQPEESAGVVTVPLVFMPEGVDAGRRGRVRISNDAADYFHGEGEESVRQRGIVLHGIMQDVRLAEDLHDAVSAAVDCGNLQASRAAETEELLRAAMDAEASRGWFDPQACINSEVGIISADGNCRPDRVVIRDGRVDIIDYKFGAPNRKYLSQVQEYMSLYSEMGYENVHGYLWFIADGRVDEVFAR
ncbi:MAG: UvrD-helicase domain-containing protein [Bacteroidales bacterium]|nr:UvrD-helicase domain-containing protein [Bacteroidales bacterium]